MVDNTTDECPEGQAPPDSKLDYVLVRHMARSPRARTLRAGRAGHRRQGVLLDDGTRIRKKGRKRLTEISQAAFVTNYSRILEFVRVGALEIVDPVSFNPIPYNALLSMAKQHAASGLESSRVNQDAPLGSERPENMAPGSVEDVPAPSEGNVYYEEELKKMTRAQLNTLASKFGVENPDNLPNKPAVVDAIIAAGGE